MRLAAVGIAAAAVSAIAAAQPPDAPPPAPEMTSEALPDAAAELTQAASPQAPTRRPGPPTATASITAPASETETATAPPATATRPPTLTRTPIATATATAAATREILAHAIAVDWRSNAGALIAGGLLVLIATWFGAWLARAGERRARRRSRRTLATAMLLELRRLDAVLRRVVALDNPASLPSLDHPIIEAALRDLTLFRSDSAARIAQFHGALRGIQQEIGDYRDNPLRWAGRLAELNQLIKSRAAAACRAVPALINALEREGAAPPPHLADAPSSAPPDNRSLPPSPFGSHEGDDWTL